MSLSQIVLLPPGEYVAGSSLTPHELSARFGGDPARYEPIARHRVKIERGFRLSKYLVTLGEFRRFVESTGYQTGADRAGGAYGSQKSVWTFVEGLNWRKPGFAQTDAHPVACANWFDAQAYIAWLNEQTGQTFRLPTEAEWEYACRAGTATEFYWGEDPALGKEYWDESFQGTSPVGAYKPNGNGLFDMLGNVWEWCADELPDDGRGKTRVVRGGSWRSPIVRRRCAFRNPDAPDIPFVCHGFRLAADC